jgi:hypothetical protein
VEIALVLSYIHVEGESTGAMVTESHVKTQEAWNLLPVSSKKSNLSIPDPVPAVLHGLEDVLNKWKHE